MEFIICEVKFEDKFFIEEIVCFIWGGEDYFVCVFDEWVRDGNFYVFEFEGKVIGMVKFIFLFKRVGWMEGLRVYFDYCGRGFGRMFYNFIVLKGKELVEEGKIDVFEFVIYFFNRESIVMVKKNGFKIVKCYYIMGKVVEEIKFLKLFDSIIVFLEEFEYEKYIFVGWKFVYKVLEVLEWFKEKVIIKECNGVKFMMFKDFESVFVLFCFLKLYVE